MLKTEDRPGSLTLYKNQLKMDQRPYCKTWNYPGETPEDLGTDDDFLNRTLVLQEIKARVDNRTASNYNAYTQPKKSSPG
jgi:hypothetical protein